MAKRKKLENPSDTYVRCYATAKLCHPSKSSARKHLKALRQNKDYGGEVYYCDRCQGWHVGWFKSDRLVRQRNGEAK